MASRICPDVLNDCNPCAGEFPWANLSAELAEPYVFVSPHIIIVPPPLGRMFTQLGCKRWCYSSISQADADACAIAQATECATVEVPDPPIVVDPPLPPTGFPQVSVFATDPTTSFGDDPGIFLLSRTGSLAQPLAIQFTLSGEAQNGVDYDTLPYTVTMDAGDNEVDVIVIPMDTGEIISKTVILTVLSGSNYSPGDSSSATVEISPDADAGNCGSPVFRVAGYGPELAATIAAIRPLAFNSDLPEWDGTFRRMVGQSVARSNAECFAIGGKRIDVFLFPAVLFEETISCTQWSMSNEQNCFGCPSGGNRTYITMDHIIIGDDFVGSVPGNEFGSQTTGGAGSYRALIPPRCADDFWGLDTSAYRLDADDVARLHYGDVIFSVVAL